MLTQFLKFTCIGYNMATAVYKISKKEAVEQLVSSVEDNEPQPLVDFLTAALLKLDNKALAALFNKCAVEGDWCLDDFLEIAGAGSVIIEEAPKKKK
jgi:hypothetical protein